jgi:hypothetical protein
MTALETNMTALETNMTALESAAHDILAGDRLAKSGKVALTIALSDVVNSEVRFTYNGNAMTCPVTDILWNVRVDGKVSQKATKALFAAFCSGTLSITDEEDQNDLRTSFAACLRAAVGKHCNGTVGVSGGHIVLAAEDALVMFNDKGEPTEAGKAVYEAAAIRAEAKAEATAEAEGTEAIMPSEDDIWQLARFLPITCSGKVATGTLKGLGKLPTGMQAMDTLTAYAVDQGLVPAPKGRASRTPGGAEAKAVKEMDALTATFAAHVASDGEPAFDLKADVITSARKLVDAILTALDPKKA